MTRKNIPFILFGFAFIAAGISAALVYANPGKSQAKNHALSIQTIHPVYAANFSDDRVLMGASHNVFVGKVIKQTGNKERGIGPETQFEVVVIHNIKGDLHGTVTVNQSGGYKDGVLYVVDGGDVQSAHEEASDYLLQPGSTYLLATRYNEKEDWYTLNSHTNARKLISRDSASDNAHLKDIANNDEKVLKLTEAYKTELVPDADTNNNNAKNSYWSLHPDAPVPPPPSPAPKKQAPPPPPPPK